MHTTRPTASASARRRARAEPGIVPIGQRAAPPARREIGPEPAFLPRAGTHRDVAVEGDDMPRRDVIAMVGGDGDHTRCVAAGPRSCSTGASLHHPGAHGPSL